MAWTKLLLAGDAATELTGTAYRMLLVSSTGAITELVHGTVDYVLTSGGAAVDPSWQAAASGAHALDAGQSDVVITTPADNEVLAYDGIGDWINQTAAEAGLAEVGAAPTAHLLGAHTTDSLANLNAVITDGDIDLDSATRVPTNSSVGAAQINAAATDIAFAQIILTPTADGTGTTEGTFMFDSDDKHAYVYVAA